jgi:hypothetical protein
MEQAIRQRLRFELAGLECRDLEQQSLGSARLLLQQELKSWGHVKSALQELLSGGSSRHLACGMLMTAQHTQDSHGTLNTKYYLQGWTHAQNTR